MSGRSRYPGRRAGIVMVLLAVVLVVGGRAVVGRGDAGGASDAGQPTPSAVPTERDMATDDVLPETTRDLDQMAPPRAEVTDQSAAPGNGRPPVRQRGGGDGSGGGTADDDGAIATVTDLTAADGYIPDGTSLSPFDDEAPAIANLDPDLRNAVQSAATDAQADGITMVINSGWRSPKYQQELLDEAIVTYGSEEEARKWVDTPDESNHVKGEAVDVGDADADTWLQEHGAAYGLCQTYANESWHFQVMTQPGGTCPAPLTDASGG